MKIALRSRTSSVKPWLKIAAMLLTLMSVQSQATQLKLGDAAPDFNVTTLSGKSFKLSDYKNNKPVYLKFWATWCSYCEAEMPHLQTIYDEYGNDIEVVTINVGLDDSVANIQELFNRQGYTLPTVFDQKGELTRSFGVVGTPYHILIDRQGKIAYRTFLMTDQLDVKIESWSKFKQPF